MVSAAHPDRGVRVSYAIGLTLVASLALLRAGHVVLPWWFDGRADRARGVHDAAVWATLHAYLLIAGFVPAVTGLVLGLLALRRRVDDVWTWVAVASNGSFVLVALQLAAVLAREGFVSFVFDALPRFLDV